MANRVAVIAAAVLTVGAIGVGLDRCGSGDTGPGSGSAAEDACKQVVVHVLRSPGTVNFQDDTAVTSRAAGGYEVTGSVEHETSAGARVRTSYRCGMYHDEAERSWKVTDIDTG